MSSEHLLSTHIFNTRTDKLGEVWLIGAGPGDPNLLTVKAHKLLCQAQIVVYDRLVGPGVMALIPDEALCIDAGKEAGDHKLSQDEINQLLVDLAGCGQDVIRLKGGDPFMFGRGGEELMFVENAGITCHVVPGITAATGCAASSGIPLTQRNVAQSVRFITGHESAGEPAWKSLESLSTSETLVIYMGVKWLASLVAKLRSLGCCDTLPIALIEQGTLPEQRTTITSLRELTDLNFLRRPRSPCLIIVGEVVRMYRGEKLNNNLELQPETPKIAAA